jgi:hypothetical protein
VKAGAELILLSVAQLCSISGFFNPTGNVVAQRLGTSTDYRAGAFKAAEGTASGAKTSVISISTYFPESVTSENSMFLP